MKVSTQQEFNELNKASVKILICKNSVILISGKLDNLNELTIENSNIIINCDIPNLNKLTIENSNIIINCDIPNLNKLTVKNSNIIINYNLPNLNKLIVTDSTISTNSNLSNVENYEFVNSKLNGLDDNGNITKNDITIVENDTNIYLDDINDETYNKLVNFIRQVIQVELYEMDSVILKDIEEFKLEVDTYTRGEVIFNVEQANVDYCAIFNGTDISYSEISSDIIKLYRTLDDVDKLEICTIAADIVFGILK